MWSNRYKKARTNSDDETFVVSGRAYPEVLAGKNPTNIVTTNIRDREQFYRDPAVKLSDENLDNCNGAEGLPLCVEHDTNKVVGHVFHSFIGDDNKRGLKIIAHIPTRRNGQDIPEGIAAKRAVMNGEFTGFSVGYGNELITATKVTRVNAKVFREISLVREPFFDNCKLAYSIQASSEGKKGFNNSDCNLNLDDGKFFIRVEMSESITGATPVATPAPASSATGGAGESIPGHELLLETNNLKHSLNSELKARQELEEQLKSKLKQIQEIEAKNKYYEEKERQEAERYAKEQEPKYEKFIQALTASKAGAMLSDAEKNGFRAVFTDPRTKKQAAFHELQMNEWLETKASKDKEAAEKKALMEEIEKLKQANAMGAKMINNARTSFSNAIAESNNSTVAEVGASKTEQQNQQLHLNGMMSVTPSLAELPFLKEHGYFPAGEVTASAYETNKPYVTEIPVAATNRLHTNEHGELNNPYSARQITPVLFHWMADNKELLESDLSRFVTLTPKLNTISQKYGHDWEDRHMVGAETVVLEN